MKNAINLWIRFLFPLFLALFMGILIFMLAQFEEPPSVTFYVILWFIGIVFLIWELGWRINKVLDQQLPWNKGKIKRLLLQLLLFNCIGLGLYLVAYILLNSYENFVLGKDNPIGLLHILVALANGFIVIQMVSSVQIGYQWLQTWQKVQLENESYKRENAIQHLESVKNQLNSNLLLGQLDDLKVSIQNAPEKASILLQELSLSYERNQNELNSSLIEVQERLKFQIEKPRNNHKDLSKKPYKSRFLARTGNKLSQIPIQDIVCFYKDDLVMIHTKDGKRYPIDQSLEELYSQLPPNDFFRINRQCIIHSKHISEMRVEGNQIQVSLTYFQKPVAVSQRNMANFKKWLNEELE